MVPDNNLPVDKTEIEKFYSLVFKHAAADSYISLRGFYQNSKALSIKAVKVGDGVLVHAFSLAQRCADSEPPAAFVPPIATFKTPDNAKQENLYQGFDIALELDESPQEARQVMEEILGPPTVVVVSGGQWLNKETGELEDKLHLHWRLAKPAQGGEQLKRLKYARKLATGVVDGDATHVPIVHPIRWAGTWHRKKEPRLSTILESDDSRELDLEAAIRFLEAAAQKKGITLPLQQPETQASRQRQDDRQTDELVQDVLTGENLHHSLVSLSTRYRLGGMHPGQIVLTLRGVMDNSEAKNIRREEWKTRYDDISRIVNSADLKFGEIIDTDPIDIFGDQDMTGAPELPAGSMPPAIEVFARDEAARLGVDPGMVALPCLCVAAAAINDGFKIQPKKKDTRWTECARLWIGIVADPGMKKSPAIASAIAPLKEIERQWAADFSREIDRYELECATYGEREKKYIKESSAIDTDQLFDSSEKPLEPHQKRKLVGDTTTEALSNILAGNKWGVLAFHDELSGWFGSFDAYRGGL